MASSIDYYAVSRTGTLKEYNKIALMKFNKYGDSLWTKTYCFNDLQDAEQLLQTGDGGYIISGNMQKDSSSLRTNILIRTDSHGDTLWTKTYGKIYLYSMSRLLQTKDGSYVLSGLFDDSKDDYYPTIIKIDKDGQVKWTKRYTDIITCMSCGITESSDNGFMLAAGGSALLKTDSGGNLLWQKYLIPRDTTVPGGGLELDPIVEGDISESIIESKQ